MAVRPTNEFNAFGVLSQDMQLRLMALATRGSETIMSVFTAAADAAGLTERGRLLRARNEERLLATMRLAMATQERLAAFQQRIERVERASYEALLEADDRRRSARRELEQLQERAYQITMPDGRTVRVYRDGDIVREDDGTIVSREVFRAEDIPVNFPTWQERQERARALEQAEQMHRQIVEYRERLAHNRDEIAQGGITSQRASELDADIEAMPEPVRQHLGEASSPREVVQLTPQGLGASTLGLR